MPLDSGVNHSLLCVLQGRSGGFAKCLEYPEPLRRCIAKKKEKSPECPDMIFGSQDFRGGAPPPILPFMLFYSYSFNLIITNEHAGEHTARQSFRI